MKVRIYDCGQCSYIIRVDVSWDPRITDTIPSVCLNLWIPAGAFNTCSTFMTYWATNEPLSSKCSIPKYTGNAIPFDFHSQLTSLMDLFLSSKQEMLAGKLFCRNRTTRIATDTPSVRVPGHASRRRCLWTSSNSLDSVVATKRDHCDHIHSNGRSNAQDFDIR